MTGPAGGAPERAWALEPFRDHLSLERGLSARTLSAYLGDLRRFAAFAGTRSVSGPAAVDIATVRAWIHELRDQGMAPASIRRARSALRTFFAWQVSEGALAEDPTERIEAPRARRRLPDHLSLAEVARVLESPDPGHRLYWRDRAILELLYASGVRVSELTGLGLPALDLEEGFALVFGKGSKERLVPIGAPAVRALRRYLADLRPELDVRGTGRGRVFLNARGRPIGRESVWRIVREAGRRAGLGRAISPHTLRHTFATHLVEGGADLAAVQELLGHADISTTEIYTHLDRSWLRDMHRRCHPRGSD